MLSFVLTFSKNHLRKFKASSKLASNASAIPPNSEDSFATAFLVLDEFAKFSCKPYTGEMFLHEVLAAAFSEMYQSTSELNHLSFEGHKKKKNVKYTHLVLIDPFKNSLKMEGSPLSTVIVISTKEQNTSQIRVHIQNRQRAYIGMKPCGMSKIHKIGFLLVIYSQCSHMKTT